MHCRELAHFRGKPNRPSLLEVPSVKFPAENVLNDNYRSKYTEMVKKKKGLKEIFEAVFPRKS